MLVNQTTSLSPKEINDHIHSIIETKSQLNELETKVNSVLNEGQCKKLTSTLELKMTILKFHSDFKENFLETSANKAHLLAFDTLSLGYIFENHFLVDKLFREEQDQKIKEIWQKLNTFFIIPEYEKAKEFIKDSSPPGPNQINEHIHDIINTKSELRHLGTEIDALTINRREEKKKTLTALLKTKITILKFYFEFETDALKNSAGKIDVPAFDVLNLPAIFENHYLLHKLTNEEQDEKIKELWQNLTTLFVIPHYKNAKNFLTASSYVYITKNAAQRGRALTNYFKALPLFEKRKILINLEGSDNLVAINEKNGKSVIKKQPQIGEIEEKRIEDLAFFYTVDGFAPSFTIRNKRRNYVDILELKKLRPSRSLLIKHFNRRFLHAVQKLLLPHEVSLLKSFQKESHILDPYLCDVLENLNFEIKMNRTFIILSFTELQREYFLGQLKEDIVLKVSNPAITSGTKLKGLCEDFLTFKQFKEEKSLLYNLLTTVNLQNGEMIYLHPDLSNPEQLQAYEKCDHYTWQYQVRGAKPQVGRFAKLHELTVEGKVFLYFNPVVGENLEGQKNDLELPSENELQAALSVPWKIYLDSLLHLTTNTTLEPLKNFSVKTFNSRIILLGDFNHLPNAANKILSRLTPQAKFNAIFTGVHGQFYDLHLNNIGVEPVITEENAKFANYHYSTDQVNFIDFTYFVVNFFEKRISERSTIYIRKKGSQTVKKLKNIKGLITVLENLQCNLLFFDKDNSLTEDIELHYQWRLNKYGKSILGHLLPIRSSLLSLNWRDETLCDETLRLLTESQSNDLHMLNWALRLDSPIRQRFAKINKQIDKIIYPQLMDYSLNNMKTSLVPATKSSIKKKCIKKIANLRTNQKLWSLIAQFTNDFIFLDTSAAGKMKRRYVAAELIPRLTLKQHEALKIRLQRLHFYLKSYDTFVKIDIDTSATLSKQLLTYIQQDISCLSEASRIRFKQKIIEAAHHLSSGEELIKVYQEILSATAPTYFNFLKVTYPLLADTYELTLQVIQLTEFAKNRAEVMKEDPGLAVLEDDLLTGLAIGSYQTTLEEIISLSLATHKPSNFYHQLALKLKKVIENKKNTPFFGEWMN